MRTSQYDVLEIDAKIENLANRLLNCNHLCQAPDIICDAKSGHIPRCLHFEYKWKNLDQPGVVVVGTNPGVASEKERADYIRWKSAGDLNYTNLQDRFTMADTRT